MILRISLLLLLCLVAPLSVAATSGSRVFHFTATLDGKPIGEHRFEVHEADGRTHVTSRARFDVKFLMFTVYRYRHEAQEVWDGNCLSRLDAHTDDNGRAHALTAERSPDGLRVDTAEATREIPGCVSSFAYWDPRILTAEQLLNTQTGDYHPIEVRHLGSEPVAVGGVPVAAERWRLRAEDLEIDLWYAPDGRWLALESPARGGRRLRYTID